MAQPKTVNLIAVDAFKIEGQHVAVGTLLKDVEADLAKELAGAGRARLATAEDMAATSRKPAKAEA